MTSTRRSVSRDASLAGPPNHKAHDMLYDTLPAGDRAMLGSGLWRAPMASLDLARRRCPDITAESLRMFVHVATSQRRIFEDRVKVRALAAELGRKYQITVSRSLTLSSGIPGTTGPAYGLVERFRDGRDVLLLLTREGADLMEEMFPGLGPAVRYGSDPDGDGMAHLVEGGAS